MFNNEEKIQEVIAKNLCTVCKKKERTIGYFTCETCRRNKQIAKTFSKLSKGNDNG